MVELYESCKNDCLVTDYKNTHTEHSLARQQLIKQVELLHAYMLCTYHGLHLSGQGKEKHGNQIVHHIYAILKQEKDSPIPLNWKERDQSGNSDIISSEWGTSGSPDKSDEKSSLKGSKPDFKAKSGQQTSDNYNIVCENLKGSKPKLESSKVQQERERAQNIVLNPPKQQESERVQKVVLNPPNVIERKTLESMSEKYIIMCENSDMKTSTTTSSLNEEPRVSTRKKKPPTSTNRDFLW